MTAHIWQAIERLSARIRSVVFFGQVTFVNDASAVQVQQIRASAVQLIEGAQVAMPWGFSSVPASGANAVGVCFGGLASSPVVLGYTDAARPVASLSGETLLYSGSGIVLKLGQMGLTLAASALPVAISGATTVQITSTGAVTVNTGGAAINLMAGGGAVAVTAGAFTWNGQTVKVD